MDIQLATFQPVHRRITPIYCLTKAKVLQPSLLTVCPCLPSPLFPG